MASIKQVATKRKLGARKGLRDRIIFVKVVLKMPVYMNNLLKIGMNSGFFLSIFLLFFNNSYSNESRSGFLLSDQPSGKIELKSPNGDWRYLGGAPLVAPEPNQSLPIIGIIDSGILSNHPQVAGLVESSRDFTGEGIEDRLGHGTLVSILTWASTNIATRLVIAKVANEDGSIDKLDVIDAINWAAGEGAEVINLSLGFREGSDDFSDLCLTIENHPNIFFIAAAGNYGREFRVYPASCPQENILSVGATVDGSVAPWSGEADIYAPGDVKIIEQPTKEN